MPKKTIKYYLRTIRIKVEAIVCKALERAGLLEGYKSRNKALFSNWYEQGFTDNFKPGFSNGYLSYCYFQHPDELAQHLVFNDSGIAVKRSDVKIEYHNPLITAYYGMVCFNYCIGRNDPRILDDFFLQASFLEKWGNWKSGCFYLSYMVSIPGFRMQPPWISGLTQALGLSLFIRAWKKTGESKWLKMAEGTFKSLFVPIEQGGVFSQIEGNSWIEEYPAPPYNRVLNGYLFCLIAINEYKLAIDENASELRWLPLLTKSLFDNLHTYFFRNRIRYDANGWQFGNIEYDGLLTCQFRHLYYLTGLNGYERLFRKLDNKMDWNSFYSFHNLRNSHNSPFHSVEVDPSSLHILWLPSWYPCKKHPWLGNYVDRRAKAASIFCRNSLLYVEESSERDHSVVRTIRNQNYTEYRVFYKSSSFKLVRIIRRICSTIRGYYQIHNETGTPDCLMLSVIYPIGMAALLLKWKLQIPLLTEEHWTGYLPQNGAFKGVFFKTLASWVALNSSSIITISPQMANAMHSHQLFGKYIVIPNVLEKKPEQDIQAKTSIFPRFIHVSLLSDRHKNISGILHAASAVKSKGGVFSLVIVGGTHEVEFFQQLAKRLEIDSIVRFTGYLSAEMVQAELNQSDIFVNFSNYEGGFPNVLLEAMDSGLPIITSDFGGMTDWINDSNGILVPVGNEKALADAMIYMLENFQQFDSEKIRESIRLKCGPEEIGMQFFKLYKEVVSSTKL